MAEKTKRREIWVADSETDPFRRGRIPVPFLWGAYNAETCEYYQFTETSEFIAFMSEKHCICYAHNGGKFDWHYLFPFLESMTPISVIAGRIAKFKIGNCEFRDSYNIIPAPLAAYQKTKIDYNIFEKDEREKPENWEKICDYLRDDCIYLADLVLAFIENYGSHLTQAGAAMAYWLKMSDKERPETSATYYMQFHKYYFGGRVECFEKGIIETDFSVIDINSAYPFAMLSDHPWGAQSISITGEDFIKLNDDQKSRAFIDLKTTSHGAFPYRNEEMELEFPADGEKREFHITGWEYLAAERTNTLGDFEIQRAYIFTDTVNFTDYVNHFFDMKDRAKSRGDKVEYLFAKIFLNALYGKFASNPEKYQEFISMDSEFIGPANVSDGWEMNNWLTADMALMCRPLPDVKKRYFDISVAASITGFVRAYLWENLNKVDRPLYCDTDSIAAEKIDRIELGDKIGQWDHEFDADFAAIGGKKLYAFRKVGKKGKKREYKTASKGARLSASEIKKVASGETVIYNPEAPTFSIKSGIRFTPRKIRKT